MLSRPHVHGAMVLRALALSLVITLVAAAAHATHDHAPSWTLLLVTAVAVAAACLPASRRRLGLARTASAMVIGQFALHAWFAWFALPVTGETATTLALHHGPSTASLASRDFSGLIPSPGMALAHLAAAGLLALMLVRVDWLLSAAAAILGGTLPSEVPVCAPPAAGAPAPLFGRPVAPRNPRVLTHDLVRRGPPAYCV